MSRLNFFAIDLEAMESRYRAHFINSLAGFKSANLVGSIDAKGRNNLAIVSSVIHLGASPPLMGMVARPRNVERHTLENLIQTGFYTLNQVNSDIVEAAHQTSARYPRGNSEFHATGLTPVYGSVHPAPYVAESRLSIGLQLRERKPIELNNIEFIIGEILEVWLDSEALQADGFVDLELLGSVAIAGLDSYHRTQRIARLSYAKPERVPQLISSLRPGAAE